MSSSSPATSSILPPLQLVVPSSSPLVRVFYDDTFFPSNAKGAIGCILFDISSKLCDGLGKCIRASSTLMSEALALKEPCQMLLIRGMLSVEVASDNKELISIIYTDFDPLWKMEAIVHDIKHLLSSVSIRCRFVPRNINRVTHWIAKEAISDLPPNWVVAPPMALSSLFCLC